MMPDSAIGAHVAAELTSNGYVVVDAFLDAATVRTLAAECLDLHAQGNLRPAAIGRAEGRHTDVAVRSDCTHWFDPAMLSPAQARYWSRMDVLRRALNRTLLLGLEELEAHFALFPPGAGYARHRDRFRDDDARVLSTVLYLNPDWLEHDGGALRLYLDGGGLSRLSMASGAYRDVYPAASRLVVFLSADFEHEVLPATRDRLSIAGWQRRASMPMQSRRT
jgi:SM-20-related protein